MKKKALIAQRVVDEGGLHITIRFFLLQSWQAEDAYYLTLISSRNISAR